LKHCLFTNEYYNRENSLILSAKINGISIETIEFSLETMEIIQCRGLKNKATEYNKRIIKLVQANSMEVVKIHNQNQLLCAS